MNKEHEANLNAAMEFVHELKKEMINHPKHYNFGKYEAIEVIEDWQLDFCLGNTVKYIARAGKKDLTKELEDLKKAKWYLERRIQQLTEKK